MAIENILVITGGAGGMGGCPVPKHSLVVGVCCWRICAKTYSTRHAKPLARKGRSWRRCAAT